MYSLPKCTQIFCIKSLLKIFTKSLDKFWNYFSRPCLSRLTPLGPIPTDALWPRSCPWIYNAYSWELYIISRLFKDFMNVCSLNILLCMCAIKIYIRCGWPSGVQEKWARSGTSSASCNRSRLCARRSSSRCSFYIYFDFIETYFDYLIFNTMKI